MAVAIAAAHCAALRMVNSLWGRMFYVTCDMCMYTKLWTYTYLYMHAYVYTCIPTTSSSMHNSKPM